MPRKGEKGKSKKVRIRAEIHVPPEEPPVLVEPSMLDEKDSQTQCEMKNRVKAEKLEEVGRSLESLPTWQLAQMAVEAGPSTSGRDEPVRKKLWLTVGGKAPQKEILQARKVKKPLEVPARDGDVPWDLSISEKYRPPYL